MLKAPFILTTYGCLGNAALAHLLTSLYGGKDTSGTPPIQYYYNNPVSNNYTIQLSVMDTADCRDATSHLLKMAPNCFIAVSSAFTPNGDGKNDFLYPLNTYRISNLVFKEYYRQGQLVFETRDGNKKWDGTIRVIAQPGGTYVWKLDYKDENNSKYH